MKFREQPTRILLFDIASAAAVAVGAGWAFRGIFLVSALIWLAVAGIVFLRIFSGLRRHVWTAFRLPEFQLPALEFEPDELLLLDGVITDDECDSRVVPIFAAARPGELRARIERHLRVQAAQQQPRSASEELAEALAELRRSLR